MASFALQIDQFVRKAKAAPELVVRKVATEMLSSIVLRTPVGNPSLWQSPPPAGYVGGRARASWRVGIGAIPAGDAINVDPSGTATIGRGMRALSSYKPGDTVWIVSRLPYIERLEYGHSTQAPRGMVRLTVAEWRDFLAKAVRTLPK